jgi:hypothetical protein
MHSLHDIQFVTHSSSVIALPHSLQISARGPVYLGSGSLRLGIVLHLKVSVRHHGIYPRIKLTEST